MTKKISVDLTPWQMRLAASELRKSKPLGWYGVAVALETAAAEAMIKKRRTSEVQMGEFPPPSNQQYVGGRGEFSSPRCAGQHFGDKTLGRSSF